MEQSEINLLNDINMELFTESLITNEEFNKIVDELQSEVNSTKSTDTFSEQITANESQSNPIDNKMEPESDQIMADPQANK
jgi:hypothetical protein